MLKALSVALIALSLSAHAITLPAGSTAALVAANNQAVAGDTVALQAGTYTLAAPINAKCGVTYTGPIASPVTATLVGSLNFPSGCSSATVTYLGFQAGEIYFGSGNTSNVAIAHSEFHSLSGIAVFFDGSMSDTTSNVAIDHNVFGDANSCTTQFATTTDSGGNCAGVIFHTGAVVNSSVAFNVFNHVEEGIHAESLANGWYIGIPLTVANNFQVEHNYFINWHRIAVEIQTGVVTAPVIVAHNVFANPLNPSYGTYFISVPCCQWGKTGGNSNPPNAALQVFDNVLYTQAGQQVGQFWAPTMGVEFWGNQSSTVNSNLVEGPMSNAVNWGYSNGSPWYIQNNYICGTHGGSYISDEEKDPTAPVQIPNTLSPTCAQQPSAAPTVTLAGNVATMSAPGNTSVWYTVDGSQPVPAAGSSKLYSGPLTMAATTTLKAVGMWGTAPQPTSYPAGYGYAPSATVSATYTVPPPPPVVVVPPTPPAPPAPVVTIYKPGYTAIIGADGTLTVTH